MGIQGDKAPGVLHRHIIAQLRAVSHRRDGPGGKGRDHRPLIGGDVQAVVELLPAAVGVLSIAEPVRHRPGQRIGIGKAQHLLGQTHVPGGVLRRIGRRVRRVLGDRAPGILGAEHRRVGVVQRLPHGALAGYRPAHGGKRRPEVRLPGHQVQQPVPVPVHSRRGRDLHHHHRQQQHRTDGQLGQAAVPPPGGGLFPLAPGRRRRRPAPPGGPRSVCHSAFPLLEQCMPPAAGIEPKNASRCIRPMAKCPRMACNRATMNAGGAAMSGIMQRRPITLYETLEALYQQVNAPFCAQRRPQRPALGGAGPGPGAYRPAGGAAAPGGGHGPAGAGGPGRSVGPGG